MSHKILIADDSLTIQKVIKITLAKEPFELEVCSSDKDLLNSLETFTPDIVLLDFNLSEDKSGYDLAKEVFNFNSNIQILMLYGTFDTIDEEVLENIGIVHKIEKPFDGNKFINMCRSMHDSISNTQIDSQTMDKTQDLSDGWVMNTPDEDIQVPDPIEVKSSVGSLEEGLADWGMEVPSVIGNDSSMPEIPEVISGSEKILNSDGSQVAIPSNEDLEYPDMDSPSSNLIAASELSSESDQVIEDDATGEYHVDTFINTDHDMNLEDQISDEIDNEDIWSPDEFSQEDDIPMIEPQKLHEVMSNTPELSHLVNSSQDVMEKSYVISDELIDGLKKELSPIIEKYVQDYCQEHVERIAWEVIPDLAENIIKKEIRKISDSIISSEV